MQEECADNTTQIDITKDESIIEEFPGIEQGKGIGGWLILPMIDLCWTALKMLWIILKNRLPVFTSNIWGELTTPGTTSYHALYGPVLIFELLYNSALVIASIIALVLLFKKSRLFPKFLLGFYLGYFILISADHVLVSLWPHGEGDLMAVARYFLSFVIWGLYMMKSKGVKATFVN